MKKNFAKSNQHHYSIMPLNENHIEEICNDIKEQYEKGAATLALFEMSLVPEGTPIKDKVETYCRVYDMYRDRLATMGLECGILVQSSIGHGYPLNEMFPFQRYVGRTDGEEKNKCCPYDEDFREHFKMVMSKLAAHDPKVIMVDDDFRLLFYEGKGCACPLHMKRFHELSDIKFSREELNERIKKYGENDKYVKLYIETQKESLVGAAKAMREGIDSVNPSIQGAYCTTGSACEFATEIAKVLAGKNNPVIIRTFIGVYSPQGIKNFTTPFYRIAQHKAIMGNAVDYIIAESDTCPQNRYAMSASQFHSFYVASVLEGVNGSKRWITRTRSYEPESGIAYRNILYKYRGFYQILAEIVPRIKPVGCCIPVLDEPFYSLGSQEWEELYDGWSRCVLERMGLPLYFSPNPSGAIFLEGDIDKYFTDEEILKMFHGTVILASDVAENLQKRKLSEYMGVEVQNTDEVLSGEVFLKNDNICPTQKKSKKLVTIDDEARVESFVFHSCDYGYTKEMLFPGSTVYKNSLGGTVVVFTGTPVAEHNYMEGYSFLNHTRKSQIVNILKNTGNLPVYYPGDADVYLRAGILPDGSLFTAIFNLSYDLLENLELCVDKKVNGVRYLSPEGIYEECDFTQNNDSITLNINAYPLLPVILIIK